ncbi:MAG: hypothetical protein EG825_13950 [Rhodocyclaceae bacterium]|nr:hypothetical protein [Rhodocyclaceae bacterium]
MTPAAPEDIGDKGAEVAGLNFILGVDAPIKREYPLANFIQGTRDEELQGHNGSRDDPLPLGHGGFRAGGERFGQSETFGDMKTHHATFHQCAGDIIKAAQAGEKDSAMKMLQYGDYVKASERVKMQLARLFVQVNENKNS